MATTILNSNLPVTTQAHSNWVVQKFGGTSVGKFARNIIEQVVEYDAFSRFCLTEWRLTILQTQPCEQPSRRCMLCEEQFYKS